MTRPHIDPNARPLSTTEVATKLGVTQTTVVRWAKAGKIPFFTTPGGHRRFPIDAVNAILRSHTLKE